MPRRFKTEVSLVVAYCAFGILGSDCYTYLGATNIGLSEISN